MTADERDTLEAKADRAMRRGELSTALALFQQLCAAFPNDAPLLEKLTNLKENLQPLELTSPKSRFTSDSPAPRAVSSTLDQAEVLAGRADYPGAIAAYREALAQQPDNELLKERLTELFALMQAQSPLRPSSVAPISDERTLNELLERITQRRKRS